MAPGRVEEWVEGGPVGGSRQLQTLVNGPTVPPTAADCVRLWQWCLAAPRRLRVRAQCEVEKTLRTFHILKVVVTLTIELPSGGPLPPGVAPRDPGERGVLLRRDRARPAAPL